MASVEQIRGVVEQYVGLVGKGSADDIVALFAPDAVLEDPVGTEPKHGHDSIREFYQAIENLDRTTELVTVRVAGSSAAFVFHITTAMGGTKVDLSPIDVMTFDDDAKITTMRAYWSESDLAMSKSS